MAHVVALDQGTTSSRAIVLDERGEVRGSAQREFEQIYPRGGWVEHDPDEIWQSQADVLKRAIEGAGIDATDVDAIGITNQRETTVLWDRSTGEPVCNAIVWQDRRTSGMCDRLREQGHEEVVREKAGLVIDAYFSGTKLAWILDRVEGARARAEKGELAFGTVDSWLMWKLTGGALHATDPTNASRTMLFDIHRGAWSEELCEILNVPMAVLPEVRPSSGEFGEAVEPIGAPIRGVAGDQHAALFGQACFSPGMAKCTYGTGCFLLEQLGARAKRSEHKLLTTVAWERDGARSYALEGSVFIGGAVVQWLRDGLKLIRESSEVGELAGTVEDNGGVYFVPAFVGLGAPHWDQYARGTMVGITRGTEAGHIARAALESIAFQIADLLEAMEKDAGKRAPELRVDGGAAVSDLLMQFQADILGVPVVRPSSLETTAFGAAYLAGLAAGVWEGTDEIASLWKEDRRFEPSMERERVDELRGRWSDAVERSLGWERSGG